MDCNRILLFFHIVIFCNVQPIVPVAGASTYESSTVATKTTVPTTTAPYSTNESSSVDNKTTVPTTSASSSTHTLNATDDQAVDNFSIGMSSTATPPRSPEAPTSTSSTLETNDSTQASTTLNVSTTASTSTNGTSLTTKTSLPATTTATKTSTTKLTTLISSLTTPTSTPTSTTTIKPTSTTAISVCSGPNKSEDSHWTYNATTLTKSNTARSTTYLTLDCENGYWLSSQRALTQTIHCGMDGNWTNPEKCVEIVCSGPNKPEESHWTYNSTTLTQSNSARSTTNLTLECEKGYWVSAERGRIQTIHCGNDGKWTDPEKCVEIVCSGPNKPEESHWTYIATTLTQSNTARSTTNLTLECENGYWLSAQRARTQTIHCGMDGNWTNPEKCVEIACPALKTEHTNKSHWHLDGAELHNDTLMNYDANVPLRCDVGYWLHPGGISGNPNTTQTLKCGINGTWTPAADCSVITCPALNTEHTSKSHWHLDGAELHNDTLMNYDVNVPLRCDVGYWLHPGSTSGNPNTTQTLKCGINGTWTPAADCSVITCPALITEHTNTSHWHLDGAELHNDTLMNYDANVPLRCEIGFWLHPWSTSGNPNTTQTLKCGINGTWTPAADCSLITCPALKTEHTNTSHWHLDGAELHNDTLMNYDANVPLRCDIGYWLHPGSTSGNPNTTQTLKCGINGTWTPAADCSLITCPALITEHTNTSHWHLDGAELHNDTLMNYDANVPLRCDIGYWLHPGSTSGNPNTTQTLKCGINGTWTPAADCSLITCPALKTEHTNTSHWHLDGAELHNDTLMNYDANVPLRCDIGYWLHPGSTSGNPNTTQTLKCGINGTWTPAADCSLITCPALKTEHTNTSHWHLDGAELHNDTLMNYDANVPLRCDIGYWLHPGSTSGNPNTTQTLKCGINGTWTPAADCSLITCPALITEHTNTSHWHLDGAELHNDTLMNYDANVPLRCDIGYWLHPWSTSGNPNTTQTLKCGINGTWTPAADCSLITCPALITEHTNTSHWHLDGAELHNDTLMNYDANVPLRCDIGYWLHPWSTTGNPNTTQTLKCGINGTWTPAADCSLITCPALITEHTNTSHWHLDGAELHNDTLMNYDANVPLRCDIGYWLHPWSTSGNPNTTQTLKCGINGTWTPAADCSLITCPALKTEHTNTSHWHLDGAELHNDTLMNYDANVPLRCDIGYWLHPGSTSGNPNTTQTLKCGINGTWTPAADCSLITCPALITEHTNTSHWHLDGAELHNDTLMNYDANVPLRCDVGYWLHPWSTAGNPNTTQTLKCGINGTWTPAADCSLITCPALITEHTNTSHWHLDGAELHNDTLMNYDANVPLRCDIGYWLHPWSTSGNPNTTQTLKCGINGTWTPAADCSLITCPALITEHTNTSHWHLDGAELHNDTLMNYDANVPLRCDIGYWLHPWSTSGNPNTTQTLKCGINGTWTPAADCSLITCPALKTEHTNTSHWHLDGAELHNDTLMNYDANVPLRCDIGYWLHPWSTSGNPNTTQTLKCGINGTWTPAADCSLITCPALKTEHTNTSHWHLDGAELHNDTLMNYDANVPLRCDVGYWLHPWSTAGNPNTTQTLKCGINGTWTPAADCSLITCPTLKTEHTNKSHWHLDGAGLHNDTLMIYDANVPLRCDVGYWLHPGSTSGNPNTTQTLKCGINGTWTPAADCSVITCPTLKTEHTNKSHWHLDGAGLHNDTLMIYDANVPLRCDVGYWLHPGSTSGNPNTTQTLKCGINGTWTPAADCSVITCPTLKTEHTNKSHWHLDGAGLHNDTLMIYDANVPLRCDVGYWLHPGSSSGNPNTTQTLKCGINGTWTPAADCSVINCGKFTSDDPISDYAQITWHSGTLFGDVTTVNCNDGYRIVGPHVNKHVSENITCGSDGRWRNMSGCELKDCGKPFEPDHGWVNISNGTAVGNTATFFCDIGYTVVGNNKTTCLNNNTWNRPTPECKINDCGNLTQPRHGNVDTSNGTTYLSVAVYSCDIGYTLLGNISRLCYANKTWGDLPPTCIINNCKDPNPISNGNYTLLNGTTTYESTVRYSCNTGYTLHGTDIRRCLSNSSWTPLDVNCTIKDCFDKVLPEFANVTFWNGTVYVSIATVQCKEGYRIIGRNDNWLTAENIKCTAYGNWSEYAGCEKKDCGKNESYDNASVLWTNETRFESSVIVQCAEGYRINGTHDNNVTNENIKCQADGHWSTSLGCIKKECPINIEVNHGNVTYYGQLYRDIASIRCSPGYKINGTEGNNIVNQTVKCQSTGRWQLPSGCVQKDCLDKEQPANASVNYLNGTLYESIAVSTCREGYRIKGRNTNANISEEIRCLDTGLWSHSLGCERKDCGSAVTVNNAHVGLQPSGNTLYEANVTVTCLTGYRLYGLHYNHQVDEQIQCLSNGSWQLSFGCERKDCGNDLNPRNANVTFPNGTTYQSTANVQCIDGYRLQGQNDNNKTVEHIQCTDGGYWDVSHGCERKDCGKPHDISNGKVTRGPWTFESTVNYTCNNGYHTVDVTTLKCNSSGLWNNNPPNCTDIDECQKRDQNDCHYYSNCTNTPGSYTCKCIEGYDDLEGNRGRRCEDHNECEDPPNTQCSFWLNKTRACVNLQGGYICICNKGWNGTKCDNDINECLEPHPCGEHGHCTNLFGSYNCSCPPQYPQGNAFLGCFEPVIISFETNGTRFNGDNEILDTFQIPNRFPYFGTYYTLFRPSMDGFLALDFQPLYNQYGGETPSEWTAAIQKHIVIAPLWTNIDSRNISNGGLWINVLTYKDKSDVAKIQDLVRHYTNQTEFNVSVALVATWKHVTIHSPYEPGYELVNHQNLSMQVILVTDGMYTYIMFNYDREQFSIRPLPEVPVASGYTHLDYSASVLSTRNNFTNLNKESNVYPAFPGRWLYNVTTITASMWNETRCLQFVKENNRTLKSWITEQLVYALPCPCQEVLMLEDYTFTRKDEILPGIGTKFTHTTCYESWFFSAYGIKQRCCYMFSKLQSQYPGAVAAEFENTTIASLLQEGYYQCCSPEGSQKYCHLYQQINPPDDCSRYTISDEIPLEDKKDTPQIKDVSVDVEKLATNPRNRVVRNVQSDGEQRKSISNVDSINNVSMFMTMYRNLKKMFGFG
ncbi:sushi, von Willebrand factor type A, EGF and pentraxin domain-containing protein 1-like isoform X24 [Dreissena polymorpha]|uniref:sushi, von Willebrand factor type A, EGF and pentraxin domain-containing protein 1-like isoform X24 n=1 Tax=Dreissena polymorpha TaxID=45954 RepID=UPI00226560D6|nr:sushi, von Willebrand factor type A, EGF and pentraxin domain-containing protein 1-like isoform X24 [Dreissena polymorpha]